jgi:hypothetical protein
VSWRWVERRFPKLFGVHSAREALVREIDRAFAACREHVEQFDGRVIRPLLLSAAPLRLVVGVFGFVFAFDLNLGNRRRCGCSPIWRASRSRQAVSSLASLCNLRASADSRNGASMLWIIDHAAPQPFEQIEPPSSAIRVFDHLPLIILRLHPRGSLGDSRCSVVSAQIGVERTSPRFDYRAIIATR